MVARSEVAPRPGSPSMGLRRDRSMAHHCCWARGVVVMRSRMIPIVAMVVSLLLLFASIAAVAVHVAHHEDQQRKNERQHEQRARARAARVLVAGELRAEQIVIGSERSACKRSAQNVVNDMNSWWEVDLADFRVAANPETSPTSAQIRLVEAEGINHEELTRATRVDYHYASKLHSLAWRVAAQKAHFSCTAAFPLP
jgi:FlaA1/EpsC-like NDP-sugar epimerase